MTPEPNSFSAPARSDGVRRNWAGNVAYRAAHFAAPPDLDSLRQVVAAAAKVKAIGSRHSFNSSADTTGTQVSVEAMPKEVDVDVVAGRVRCSGGLTHAELAEALDSQGLALPNMASLPHISVAGAIQTGTHGSGVRNPSLSGGVRAVELVDAFGERRVVGRSDPHFQAVVVGLGAFGVVTHVTQDVVPAFEVEQSVFQGVRWTELMPALEEVMASAYSVSLFTNFEGPQVGQVWVKRCTHEAASDALKELGGVAARLQLHPVPDMPADNVTEQLGRPGPSPHRLPHFRADFLPSHGDEIQSEFFVPAENGHAALEVLLDLGPRITPLLHVSEVRRIARDSAWLSPASERDSLSVHFTWRSLPDEVMAVLPVIEEALDPLGGRPHWGKVFVADHARLRAAYPKLEEFAQVASSWDPHRKFRNEFLDSVLGDR